MCLRLGSQYVHLHLHSGFSLHLYFVLSLLFSFRVFMFLSLGFLFCFTFISGFPLRFHCGSSSSSSSSLRVFISTPGFLLHIHFGSSSSIWVFSFTPLRIFSSSLPSFRTSIFTTDKHLSRVMNVLSTSEDQTAHGST